MHFRAPPALWAERTTMPTLKETLAQAEEQQLHQLTQLWGLEALDGQDRQLAEATIDLTVYQNMLNNFQIVEI